MKKVLLLGDSIRMGYDDYVKELLEGKCEVYYDAADNSRFAPYTLWQLIQMYNQYGPFDLVHWNNGYWDMSFDKTTHEPLIPVEEYAHYLRRIARILKNKGAKVVFALTTPILTSGSAADNTGTGALNISFNDELVQKYNSVAQMIMEEERITINDLYSLCKQDKNYFKCEDMLHLTDDGYRTCAKQISEVILKELDIK